MQRIREVFDKAKREARRRSNGLVCKCGSYDGCIVLKLQKASWTNDSMDVVRNRSGVFFSIWVELKDTSRLHYNIHALKMRELRGYDVTSRAFADDFRKQFAALTAC